MQTNITNILSAISIESMNKIKTLKTKDDPKIKTKESKSTKMVEEPFKKDLFPASKNTSKINKQK